MKAPWIFWLVLLLSCKDMRAQVCPSEYGSKAKEPSTLHGKLIYNEDLRQWHELKLDKETCDWESVEVVSGKMDMKQVHRYCDCGVTITGSLFIPITGYYSLGLAMDVDKILSDEGCKPYPNQPDLSKVQIPKNVRSYEVTIQVDYRSKGSIDVKVRPTKKSTALLKPWQAYANYFLTGSRYGIWFDCADGFEMIKANQIPKIDREIFVSMPGDNYTTFSEGSGLNTLTFGCRRVSQ
jgi:hypothetical protein